MADETFQPTITVYPTDFETALKHGAELWWDGSTPTKRLDQRDGRSGFTRYVNARAEGKLAEVAFSRFLLEHFSIDSEVDWRIYGDYEQTDDGDLQYLVGDDGAEYPLETELDVKKTKPWNQWLALRRSMFEKHPANAPFVLCKLVLEDDLDLDDFEDNEEWPDVSNTMKYNRRLSEYVSEHFPLSVQIVGSAYPSEFTDSFDKGDRLYDPETGNKLGGPLRMDNEAIHVDDLVSTKSRWNRIVEEIVGDNPISYDEL